MRINNLSEEDLKTLYSNRSKYILKEKDSKAKKEYISLYNLYRKLFTEYIVQKLELNKYDKELEESILKFYTTPKEDMDVYQYFSSEELKYFYIRNNIYIERLTDENIKFLRDKIEKKNYDLDDETKELIENTYKKVIYEGNIEDGKKYITLYGPNNRNYLAPSDSIVIGFRYDEFFEDRLEDAIWRIRHLKQVEYLDKIFSDMNNNFGNIFEEEVKIFRYSQFSVIKRIRTSGVH